MNDIQPLTNLQCGQTARVGKLTLQGSMRRRLQDIGLIEGTQVECVQKSPAGDPEMCIRDRWSSGKFTA